MLGVEVKDLAESCQERLAEASFISVDHARALITVGELAQLKEVHIVALPSFDKEVYRRKEVFDGEEVMTLRPEERGTDHFS